jgi:hypothetical protein
MISLVFDLQSTSLLTNIQVGVLIITHQSLFLQHINGSPLQAVQTQDLDWEEAKTYALFACHGSTF